jgi:hypothetical protein
MLTNPLHSWGSIVPGLLSLVCHMAAEDTLRAKCLEAKRHGILRSFMYFHGIRPFLGTNRQHWWRSLHHTSFLCVPLSLWNVGSSLFAQPGPATRSSFQTHLSKDMLYRRFASAMSRRRHSRAEGNPGGPNIVTVTRPLAALAHLRIPAAARRFAASATWSSQLWDYSVWGRPSPIKKKLPSRRFIGLRSQTGWEDSRQALFLYPKPTPSSILV